MEIFLTGGTGYLGGRLATDLLGRGHRVRLLYRDPARLPEPHPHLLPVRGRLERAASLTDAIRGVDAVVHTAALVRSWVRDPAEMRAANVDAVATLIDMAHSLGVGKIVYTSSFMALGPSTGAPHDEDTPAERTHFHNLYEETKVGGDRLARAAQAAGAPVVILYPTVVYGPGPLTAGNHVTKIIRQVLDGKLHVRIGRGDASWNYAYIDDVVEGHVLALERAETGTRYILGGENVTIDGFLETLAEVSGASVPERRVPRGAARSIAAVLELLATLTGREPPLTRGVLAIYERDWAYRTARAERDLGYRPIPFREGLARTVSWLTGGQPVGAPGVESS